MLNKKLQIKIKIHKLSNFFSLIPNLYIKIAPNYLETNYPKFTTLIKIAYIVLNKI